MKKKKCPICKTGILVHKDWVTCASRICSQKYFQKKNKETKVIHICQYCGKEFTTYRYSKRKYCCKKCEYNKKYGSKK